MNKVLIVFCLCLAVVFGQLDTTPTRSTPGTRTTPEGCNREECEKLACDEEGMVPKPLGLDEDGCCMTFECVSMPTMPTPTGSTPGTRTTPEGCNREECEKLACDEEGMVPKPLGLDEDGCCMTFECVSMPTMPIPTGSTPGTRTTPEGCNREKLACDEEGMVPKPLGLDEDGCCMTFECVSMPTMPTPTGSTPGTRTISVLSTTLTTEVSTIDSSSPTVPITTTTAAPSMFTTCINRKDENGNKCDCDLSGCNACEVQNSEVVCTSCDENRFLRDGRCPRSAACKRGKIEDAPEGHQDCECPAELNNCHICIISKTKDAYCDTCRDGKKLLDGKCVDSCPTGYHLLLKGSSSFGARCEENYRCRKGKIRSKDHPRQGEGCTCEGDCYDCDYIFGEGHVCRGCTNEKFLHEGQCVDDCSEVGKAHYGYRTRNRVCIDNLTCKGGKNVEDKSQKCACPPSSGGYKCVRCHFEKGNEAEGARCDKCKIGFLHEGTCVDECPTGFEPNPGSGKRGRFCIPTN